MLEFAESFLKGFFRSVAYVFRTPFDLRSKDFRPFFNFVFKPVVSFFKFARCDPKGRKDGIALAVDVKRRLALVRTDAHLDVFGRRLGGADIGVFDALFARRDRENALAQNFLFASEGWLVENTTVGATCCHPRKADRLAFSGVFTSLQGGFGSLVLLEFFVFCKGVADFFALFGGDDGLDLCWGVTLLNGGLGLSVGWGEVGPDTEERSEERQRQKGSSRTHR